METKALALGLVAAGSLFFLARRAGAMGDKKLGRYFSLSEFLRSEAAPQIRDYRPSALELSRARTLVKYILDPLRERVGQVKITGGFRPKVPGVDWVTILKARGYTPALDSDHYHWIGVDIYPISVEPSKWPILFFELQNNPYVRQVIMYWKHNADGKIIPQHFHVSVVSPGFPRIASPNFAFLKVDNERVKENV